jgi:excisionase family DNA binding protein
MEKEKVTLTVEEAGKLLGISRPLVYQMAKSGQLPILRFGKRILIPKVAFEEMLASSRKANPS